MTTMLVVLAFVLAGPGVGHAHPLPDPIVAAIGDEAITRSAFLAHLDRIRREGDPETVAKSLSRRGRAELLNDLVTLRLCAMAARTAGLGAARGAGHAAEEASSEVLATAYLQEVLGDLVITDAQAKAYYESHSEEFTPAGRVRARHIVVNTRTRAEEIRAALHNGSDFAKLARERSVEAATASRGGELGWISPGVMAAPFDRAVFRLKVGEISQVVQTRFGYHVIRVDEVAGRTPAPFEVAKPRIRERLTMLHVQRHTDRLKARFGVTVFPEFIEKVDR